MGFDIPTLLNRVGHLNGMDRQSREVDRRYDFQRMCGDFCSSNDFPDYLKKAVYKKDTKNIKPSEKIDTFEIASYTQWIDQLSLYASIRKGMGELESYTLSYVAQREIKDDKLDYADNGSNIKTLPYDNYELFVEYNIKDVYLLYKIEEKNNDIDLLYSIAEITKTRLNKAMRKTVSLKNMAHHFYLEQGFVQGNNGNASYGTSNGTEEKEKFEGQYKCPHKNLLIAG